MIGTLTRYELKKSVWNKFFLIIFALLLLANVLLNCGIQDFLNWMDAVENGTALGEITAENTNFWVMYMTKKENDLENGRRTSRSLTPAF